MQGELMAVDHQPILLTDGMVHLTVQSKMGQIDDRAAVFANKVAMGGDNGVKTLLSLNDSYAPGWPLSFYCIEWTVPYPPP